MGNHQNSHSSILQSSSAYFQDVIVMEAKEMNTTVKLKYLEDYTANLRAHNEQNINYNRINIEDAQLKNREMQKQTLAALQNSINKMSNIEEYNVEQVCGDWIKGPMKWIILIFGSNHRAKDLGSLLRTEYKNLNVIVVLVTNN